MHSASCGEGHWTKSQTSTRPYEVLSTLRAEGTPVRIVALHLGTSAMGDPERKASIVEEQDESRLAELGYKQELNRNWSVLHNFGVSFSIISVVTGITTLFSYGLNTGGPGVMTSGWLIGECFPFEDGVFAHVRLQCL